MQMYQQHQNKRESKPLPCQPLTSLADEEIKVILQDRVDRARRSVGVVVGIVDDRGTRVISYGKPSLDSDQAVNGDTVFELASCTKVFTGTLLGDMVEQGEVNLDDPISTYLPKSVKTPTYNGKEIALRHLANHTSGLPMDADNLSESERNTFDMYADYPAERMYAFLSTCKLTREIGAKYEYSNFGVGLLGHILELHAGMNFENLIQTRICRPLHMENTGVRLTNEMQKHLAVGHNNFLKPIPGQTWNNSSLTGAGALHSTVHDLLRFVEANLSLEKTHLSAAMEKAQFLSWGRAHKSDSIIINHTGNSYGYCSYIGFDKKKHQGIVILSNVACNSVEDIGYHLLNSQCPLEHPEALKEHKAIKLDGKRFDPYVGEYQTSFSDFRKFTVFREGDKLFTKVNDKPKSEIFAESETDFFNKYQGYTIAFFKNDQGVTTHLMLKAGLITISAKKIK